MADDSAGEAMEPSASAPQAIVRTRARPSIVWLIPLIAAAVGLYLAYWAWSEQGPTVTIIFDSAEGLEAGQTKLKYKEVDVGLVPGQTHDVEAQGELLGVTWDDLWEPESWRVWDEQGEQGQRVGPESGEWVHGVSFAMRARMASPTSRQPSDRSDS